VKAATGASVSSASVALRGPAGYTKSTDTATLPGVELTDPVAVAAGGKRIVAGKAGTDAQNFLLLPTPVVQAIGGVPKDRPAVKLPGTGQPAYRYSGLKVDGISGDVTVFAVQTDSAVYTVACIGGVPAGECDSAAASLSVKDGSPQAVGPSKDFAAALSATLNKVGKARSAGRKRLKSAKDNKAQAAAASSVSAAYAKAVKAGQGATVHPSDKGLVDVLAGAFKKSKTAWGQLASAARKNNRAAYVRGQRAVRNAEKDVAGAMSALKAAGYDVKG